MAAIRDLNSGMSFEKLKDLGCFDEEFSAYGIGYIEQGQSVYVIGNSGSYIYALKERLLAEKQYSTPVEHKIVRRQVDSGTINDVNQQIKINFAKQLRKQYGEKYFETLQWLSEIEHNNDVSDLLKAETKRITGYFNREDIQLFEGLLQLAYECKNITQDTYQQFQKWLDYAHKQLENEIETKGKFRISYYGFGYEKDGKLEYYHNAQMLNAYKKWNELRNHAIVVTPILVKEYWENDLYQLSSHRREFLGVLQQYIDNEYWKKVKSIYLTELQIDKKLFATKLKDCAEQCNTDEMNSLNLYKFLFNI